MPAAENLKNILEAALLASGGPLSLDKLQELFTEDLRPDKRALREALDQLAEDYEGRGVAVVEVSSGWRVQVRSQYAPWVSRLWEEKPARYSRALMETLALIAYRQPITRGEIEEIRGVSVSTNIIRTLLERGWVNVVGQRDVPGRPSLYATTKAFLDYFGLRSLDALPTLAEIRDVEEINQELNLPYPDQDADVDPEQGADPGPDQVASAHEGGIDPRPDEPADAESGVAAPADASVADQPEPLAEVQTDDPASAEARTPADVDV